MLCARSGLFALAFTLALAAAPSCTPAVSSRLTRLNTRVALEERKLARIARQQVEAEARATAARTEARYQNCRASAGELRAEIARRRANCAKDLGDYNLCLAMNEKKAANGGFWGCAIGILLGMASGGTAMPWALGGCTVGLGAGAAASKDCPSAACTETLPKLPSIVLADRRLAGFPHCGGYFGLALRHWQATAPAAIRIERVEPGSTAQSASMTLGDALFSINGQVVSNDSELERTLSDVHEGDDVRLSVIRDGQWLELKGTANRRNKSGDLMDHVQLGAELGDALESVPYDAGVAVAEIDPHGPAQGVMFVDDVIVAVGTDAAAGAAEGQGDLDVVSTPEAMEERLEAVRAGKPVIFRLRRGLRETLVELRPAERGERQQL